MNVRIPLAASVAVLALMGATQAAQAAERPLRIAVVDVEGGSATLYVTPEGHSLLIDTGWPPGLGGPRPAPGAPPPPPFPSSAERIVAAAKSLGVSKIDYLLLTHYHLDHIGGFDDVTARIPVGAFVDHGPNRQPDPPNVPPERLASSPAILYAKYLASIAGKKHIVMKPGETLKIDGLTLTAVDSDREVIAKALPGGGKPNPACAGIPGKAPDGGEENPRSLGVVASYGKARILALGDTTWDMENKLACPVGLIGPIDLVITTHHGSNLSGSPALYASITPTVAITPNGATKGGDAEVFDVLKAQPSLKDVWQLHTATKAPDKNPAEELIANPASEPDAYRSIVASVDVSGAVTVTNTRNNVSRTYPKAKH